MKRRVYGAVDIGASGGRIIAGIFDGRLYTLHTVHRFPNAMEDLDGHLRWGLTRLFEEVITGLRVLSREFPDVESIGIDTWGVDYGLLDADGRLLAEPVAYRDGRTELAVDRVHARIPPDELYRLNGLQVLPFNTIYQLEAEKISPLWAEAAHILLLPDLISYWLTGEMRTELTNASTTGLLDVNTREWSAELFEILDLPAGRFRPIESPGEARGPVRPEVRARTGLSPAAVVTTVASHDTASAVVAIPSENSTFAYVSCGTWSLAGLELDGPVTSADSRCANFTNEAGVDGRIRYLRNVGGLWLIQESLRTWASEGLAVDLDSLLAQAEILPPGGPTIDVQAPELHSPGDIPTRIGRLVIESGETSPDSPAATVRCILDSLASAYARTIQQAGQLARRESDIIHIVGGGAQNRLLCQLTANSSGLPVRAGPVEATALGNILIQARAHGAAPLDLDELRQYLSSTQSVHFYTPSSN